MASQIIFTVLTFLLGSLILVNGDGVCTYFEHSVGYACSFYTTLTFDTPESTQFIITGTHISGKTDADVKFIQQNNARMDYIPPSIFTKFVNLVEIDFPNVGLKSLTAQTFKSAFNLKKVWLYNNQIPSLPGNAFANTKIELIFVNDNAIAQISYNAFTNCPNLDFLQLHNNNISKTIDPRVFQNLGKLKTLLISNNQIDDISVDTFKDAPQLNFLSLGGNRIRKLDSEPFKPLTSLKYLHLYNNNVEYVDKNFFDTLQILDELQFYGNKCADFDLNGIQNVNLEVIPRIKSCFNEKIKCRTICRPVDEL